MCLPSNLVLLNLPAALQAGPHVPQQTVPGHSRGSGDA